MRRAIVVAVALACALSPAAAAKFRLALTLSDATPQAGQAFEVRLRTGATVPNDDWLDLVAVAPGRDWYDVVGTATGATSHPSARIPRDGFLIQLDRAGPRLWVARVTLHRPGRWQLIVPNWGHLGFAIPPPLARVVDVSR